MSITIVPEKEITESVHMDQNVISAIEQAYARLSSEPVEMPPVMQINNPGVQGQTCIKSALVPTQPSFAAKVSSIFPMNSAEGLPPNGGLMVVFNSRTGIVEAILLDNGYLTQVRTAAGGAVAAKHLAPKHVETAGIIGSGKQARMQAEALKLVRDFDRVIIWARSKENAETMAGHLDDALKVSAEVVEKPNQVLEGAQAVITATSTREPVVKADWLHSGLHITAMGSDAAHKNELEPEALTRADYYICDSRKQCEQLGELHHAIEAGISDRISEICELGEVINGLKKPRTQESDVTICDLTGVGVQDTAIAVHALEKARSMGKGFEV